MATTKVLLTHPVEGLGAEADVVTVKAGYARNFLIPSGKAWEVTPSALKRLDALRAKRAEREANELNEANDLARRINKINMVIVVETGESGKAFGAVTANDIALKLKGELGGREIDRHRLALEAPIKGTGEFEIPVKLHPEVTAKLSLTVKPSKEPAPEGEAAEESHQDRHEHQERRGGWRTRPRKVAPKE
jgi:large subunit ribosomal protein L9